MTSAPAIQLDELERDALTELANLGVSRAAASLRDMVGQQVFLSVPAIEIMTRESAAKVIGDSEASRLVAVHQAFDGALSGRALLIFPEANSLALVRAVTGGELPLDDIIELEQEALAETGNIILNGCLATIANQLQRSLKMSLPEIIRGSGADFFDPVGGDGGDLVLFLYINFSVNASAIRGFIAMLLDLPSLMSLKALMGEFILRATGEPVSPADVAT